LNPTDQLRSIHASIMVPAAVLACVALALMPGMSLGWQLVLLAVGVVSVGMPHGAMDHRVAELFLKPRIGERWKAVFAIGYVGLMLIVLAGWWVLPGWTLVAFLAYSAVHFGLGDDHGLPWWQSVWRGGLPIVLPLAFHPAEAGALLGQVSGLSVDLMPARGWLIGLAIVCLVLSIGLAGVSSRVGRMTCVELTLLVVMNWVAPPLLAFGFYFVLIHSVRHMIDLADWLSPGRPAAGFGMIVRQCWPLTLITLALMGAGVLWLSHVGLNQPIEASWVKVLFVTLSALTVPHMLTTAAGNAISPASPTAEPASRQVAC